MNTKTFLSAMLVVLSGLVSSANETQPALTMQIAFPRNSAGIQMHETNRLIGKSSAATCFAQMDVFAPKAKVSDQWELKTRKSVSGRKYSDNFQFQMDDGQITEGDSVVVLIFCDVVDGTIAGNGWSFYSDLEGISEAQVRLADKNTNTIDQLDVVREKSLFNYRIDLIQKNGILQKKSSSIYKFSSRK